MLNKNPTTRAASPFAIESLETRVLLSQVATVTKIVVTPGAAEMGKDLIASVRVQTAGGGIVNKGTVQITDNGVVVATASLGGTRGKIVGAINSIDNATGGNAFFTGTHHYGAVFLGKRDLFAASRSRNASATITTPAYNGSAGQLRTATEKAGTGTAATTGTRVTVSYTGYLAASGLIFDSSTLEAPTSGDGTGQTTFTLGNNNAVKGFNDGIVGMNVGETRVIYIPAAQGYGSNPPSGAGPTGVTIPADADLVFVVNLVRVG